MSRVVYVGTAPHRVKAEVIRCGADYSVIFTGGTRAHIGAVAVGYMEEQDGKRIVRVQSFGIQGHRETELAEVAVQRLALRYRTTVVVSAGLHIDQATKEDIMALCDNFYRCLDLI